MDTQKIAKKLIQLRGTRTQSEVAKEIGVCQSTYAMYELGQRMPSDEKKKKIADYHGCTVQQIFFD